MAKREAKKAYKIGDVCRVADVQPYVLRYWETEFPALAPEKSTGGQRVYTDREVNIILRIKQLLYSEGFTIAGAKKKLDLELNENNEIAPQAAAPPAAPTPVAAQPSSDAQAAPALTSDAREVIESAKKELRELLKRLS